MSEVSKCLFFMSDSQWACSFQDSKTGQKSVQVSDTQWAIDRAYEAKTIWAFAIANAEMTVVLFKFFLFFLNMVKQSFTFYMVNW